MSQKKYFLSYYGDDFTGSTDVMESLALNGIPTVLFLKPPKLSELEEFQFKIGIGNDTKDSHIAFGVAGIARSLSPAQMDDELSPVFEKISQIPTEFFQYKICSTFDSSPDVGNIGHATDLALKYFPSNHIPLSVGAPFLNRFVVFGNLFARVGDTTYRLDRHPTMTKHPVTPMNESDLRIHLGQQTDRKVNLIDVFALENKEKSQQAYSNYENKGEYILFDTLTENHLISVGRLLIENKNKTGTQLLVGASGMDYALTMYMQQKGELKKVQDLPSLNKAKNLIVIAGSCSPTTANQIDYMLSRGGVDIRINTINLVKEGKRKDEIDRVFETALGALIKGNVPIIYSAKGPNDPSIAVTKKEAQKKSIEKPLSEILAGAQGEIAKRLLEKKVECRIVVAGGDTSGYVCRALGIYALETLQPIAPGAPLCKAHSNDKRFDGVEIALKGGQNGNKKYFESILLGYKI